MTKYERFGNFGNYILEHQKRGFDNCIAVTGAEQSGKSTLICQLGIFLLGIASLPQFKQFLEKNIGYKLREITEEIKKIEKWGYYGVDEAIRGMYKRDALAAVNKELIRVFTQIGMLKGTFPIAIPRFTDLDEYYRNHRIRYWLEVIGNEWDTVKGKPSKFYAVVFERDTNAFNPDPWGLKKDWKYFSKRGKPIYLLDSIREKIKMYRKCQSFQYYITYPPLKDDYWNAYFEMSSRKKMDDDAIQTTSKYEDAFSVLAHYCNKEKSMSTREIERATIPPNKVQPLVTQRTIVNKINTYAH